MQDLLLIMRTHAAYYIFMVSFIATEVNINVLFVQSNGYLLFTFGLMVGFLLACDVKHQHVASGPSTQATPKSRKSTKAGRVWGTGQ